jgi:predicted DNA-binding antitoxin AbrB/MazE fold protein
MEKKIQAVYTDGVLRLAEPLQLEEMQQVTVTITDSSTVMMTSPDTSHLRNGPRPRGTPLPGMIKEGFVQNLWLPIRPSDRPTPRALIAKLFPRHECPGNAVPQRGLLAATKSRFFASLRSE